MASEDQKTKRPRLSLQIKNVSAPGTRLSRTLAIVDPKSPTTFNTLSNVYVTAIERSTPIHSDPLTAINTQQPLKIQTGTASSFQRVATTPYTSSYPETPLTAQALSPMNMEITFPSVMTATPPLSAGPIETSAPAMFTFTTTDHAKLSLNTNIPPAAHEARTPRRSATAPHGRNLSLPYNHPRSLHSILRNSPLPPSSAIIPLTPRRQSLRLQEKAARRVAYNSPLEQTITTSRYIKSHIDLLSDDGSPCSPAAFGSADSPITGLDAALAFTSDETRDGGQTPGPFEEMRRRMAGLATTTPTTATPGTPGGIRKRRKKDKKRRWVWTIGQEEDADDEPLRQAEAAKLEAAGQRAASVLPVPTITLKTPVPRPSMPAPTITLKTPVPRPSRQVPMPSIEVAVAQPELEPMDVEMSDTCSLVSDDRSMTPCDLDLVTPVASFRRQGSVVSLGSRLGSVGPFEGNGGGARDTPVPPELMVG